MQNAIARAFHGRFHYAWIVAGITFLVLLMTAGSRSTSGLLIVPLEAEFGWARGSISIAIAINIFLFGFLGPFAAALIERYGIRAVVMASLAGLIAAIAGSALMTELSHMFVLWGFVVGTCTGMTSLVVGAVVANRWFTTRRGLVMGLLTASNATGQIVFLPALAAVLEAHGWRFVAYSLAGVMALVLLLVFVFLRDRPDDIGLPAYGDDVVKPPPTTRQNPLANAFGVLRNCVRSKDFWLLFASFFVCGLSTNGLIAVHLIPACFDAGIPMVQAAWLLFVMGLFDFVGTVGAGYLTDRFDPRKLLFFFYGFRGLSLLLLPFTDFSFYGLAIFAAFYGLDWIATAPPTMRLCNEIWGQGKGPIAFGWLVTGHQIGGATAAMGAGLLRDDLGSYFVPFLIAGAACLVTAIYVLGVGNSKDRIEGGRPVPAQA